MNMALSPAHTDDRPGVVPIHDDSSSSQRDFSSNSASAETSSSTSTRFVENKTKEERVFLHNKSTTTPPSQIQSRLPVGEQVNLQWKWEWEENYGNLTGEEKKWVTVSLLDDDDDDDDDFIGNDHKGSEGCGKQTVDTCVFVSQPLLHFLCYFLC